MEIAIIILVWLSLLKLLLARNAFIEWILSAALRTRFTIMCCNHKSTRDFIIGKLLQIFEDKMFFEVLF